MSVNSQTDQNLVTDSFRWAWAAAVLTVFNSHPLEIYRSFNEGVSDDDTFFGGEFSGLVLGEVPERGFGFVDNVSNWGVDFPGDVAEDSGFVVDHLQGEVDQIALAPVHAVHVFKMCDVVTICIWRGDLISLKLDLLGWQVGVSNWFFVKILESETAYNSNAADGY